MPCDAMCLVHKASGAMMVTRTDAQTIGPAGYGSKIIDPRMDGSQVNTYIEYI